VNELLSESIVGVSIPVTKGVDKVEGGVGLGLPLGDHVVNMTVLGVSGGAGDGLSGLVLARLSHLLDGWDVMVDGWDGVNQGGGGNGSRIGGKAVGQEGGISLGLALAIEVAGGTWDWLVCGIHAGGGLAVDKGEAVSVDTAIAQPGLSLGLALAIEVASGTWDGLVGGVDAGGGLAVDNGETVSVDTTVAQPGLSLSLTLANVGTGDRLVGGIHAGGGLAVDNREAVSVDTTVAQPGLGGGGSHSGEHSNEGLHVCDVFLRRKR